MLSWWFAQPTDCDARLRRARNDVLYGERRGDQRAVDEANRLRRPEAGLAMTRPSNRHMEISRRYE